jgi:hypothetical protein
VNLSETAYQMPTGMLLHEAQRQHAMAEITRDTWQQVLYERGAWFLLLVWAERTCGVQASAPADDWMRPDNTCPRCQQPAANLFRTKLPGDELDTTHCGCLYTSGVSASDGKTQAGASAPKAAVPEVERDAEVAGVILNLRDDAHRLRNGSEFTTAQIADDLDLLADRLAAMHPTTAKEPK